eukprot:6212163-Pleurochrysis_carterae.AAC.2
MRFETGNKFIAAYKYHSLWLLLSRLALPGRNLILREQAHRTHINYYLIRSSTPARRSPVAG